MHFKHKNCTVSEYDEHNIRDVVQEALIKEERYKLLLKKNDINYFCGLFDAKR